MKKCDNCYYCRYVNIGGMLYPWCFNVNKTNLLNKVYNRTECEFHVLFDEIINVVSQELSRNQKSQRNNKVKQKCKIFRYSYKLDHSIAYIISRFSHWILVLSDNKEHLYHQNMNVTKIDEYYNMFLTENPTFHIHKIFDNNPLAVQFAFDEIENHDIYVLNNRYQASIRKRFIE